MSSEHRRVNVIAVSRDIALLHEISWTLEAVGYKVETASDPSAEALWRRYSVAEIVLIDGRDIKDPCGQTFALDSENPTYRFFLYDQANPTDLAAWYAVGAHDALRVPLSRGELLARARTAARYLEFERRMRRRSSRSTLPGVYSRRGLLQKMSKLVSSENSATSPCTLLVTSIDWYAGVRFKFGETATRSLESAAARAIKRAAGDKAILAYFGEGRFVTMLAEQEPAAVKALAESISKDFTSRESRHESIPRPTLTSAAIPWKSETNPDQCLNEAFELLELAGHSGDDCVLLHGDYNKQVTEWQQEMSTGNPFSNVVAQDIMEPFPALLYCDKDNRETDLLLRDAGFPVRPYVDHLGKLNGIAGVDNATHDATGHLCENLVVPETIPFGASFAEIYEAFSSRGCAALVVTHDERPLGYITCNSFLSLIDPIDSESFSFTDKPLDDISYLVVPPLACESPALEAKEA